MFNQRTNFQKREAALTATVLGCQHDKEDTKTGSYLNKGTWGGSEKWWPWENTH